MAEINLSRPFILRPIMTILVMVFMLFMGFLGYEQLPVSDLPNVDFPTITVTTQYPGTSPETIANIVSAPLEKQFMGIPAVANVTSSNTLGQSKIVLQFDLDKNIIEAAQEVQQAITQATAYLPPNLPYPPTYQKVNPSDTPILYISLTSETMDLGELYKYGFTIIAQRLSMLEGVAQVLVYGAPYAARINFDPYYISTLGLTFQDLSNSVADYTPNLPVGQLDGFQRSWIIASDENLQNAEEFEPVVVRWQNGAYTRIEDIGSTQNSTNNIRISSFFYDKEHPDGVPSVTLAILKQPGSNTVHISDLIAKTLPQLSEELPKSIRLQVMFDKSLTIRESIDEVELTLFIALILVTFVIFIYLNNLRDTLIPAISMPLSIIATFWFMDLLNYSVDTLSMLGLILSTGFIVDDAIVVLENIVHHVEKGYNRWKAAIVGSKLISFTILSMTLSLAAVFIPLVYMGGVIGRLFREFAVVMILVVLMSGFISLTLTPMLCSRLVSLKKTSTHNWISKILNVNFLNFYKRTLTQVLHNKPLALIAGLISVMGSVLMFYVLPQSFLPDEDIGFVVGFTQAQEGTSPGEMTYLMAEGADILKGNPNIVSFLSINGFPTTNQGIYYIRLVDLDQRTVPNILSDFTHKLQVVPGFQTFLKNVPLINLNIGTMSRGAYQYSLMGMNSADVYQATQQMVAEMKKLPELQGVNSDLQIHTPQLRLTIDRDQAASFGITPYDVQNTFLLAYSGNRVARIQTPFDQYDVITEVPQKNQRLPFDINALWMRNGITSDLVPLKAFTKAELDVGLAEVDHINQFPASTIAFNLEPGYALSTALDKINQIAEKIVPHGVFAGVKGAAQTFAESISSLGILFIFAIIAIYIILGILYESFIHPLTILSSLPPAIFGGLLTLWIFNLPLDLYGYLGLILLIGIVKKNGIMMVDFALENKRVYHEDKEKAIYDAAVVRFRPIMMTTFAAIMGAVPLFLVNGPGTAGRRPMAYVIIGGLLFSQMITLYITPVIYCYLDTWSDRLAFSEARPDEEDQQIKEEHL